MEILVGLDVSVASTSVCALNANGETVNEAKVLSDPESLAEHLGELLGSVTAVGLEAALFRNGFTGDCKRQQTRILIDRLVHHCHIVNIRGNSYRMRDHQNLLRSGLDRRRGKDGS